MDLALRSKWQNLARVLRPPDWLFGPHVLGTDAVGRDILSRLFYGARISLVIAVMVVIISGVVGLALGAISGYFAGTIDFRFRSSLKSCGRFRRCCWRSPSWRSSARGSKISSLRWSASDGSPTAGSREGRRCLRTREFVDAARSLGAGHTRIILHHILPNLFPSAVVIGTFSMASAIISEAALSFLGLGVPPEIPTWGTMLADGRTYISTSWWLALFPGLCIFFTVLGINLLGDGLRDILDPRLKRSGSGIG